MENYLVNSIKAFYNARKQLGYVSDDKVQSLIIALFIYRLVFFDYRGVISECDYHIIERAINCLYGKNCLLPYRDYLKMGKLKLGEYTELTNRVKKLENKGAEVISVSTSTTASSDTYEIKVK